MKAVEEQLRELVELPFDDVVARCAITTRTHPDYVRPECLVHMLRRTRDDNSDARFNRLFPLLLKRIAMALPRAERKEGKKVLVDAVVSAINEAALDRVKVLLTLDRSGGDRLDFYEVHFDEAVAKLRAKARGTMAAARRARRRLSWTPKPTSCPPASSAPRRGSRSPTTHFFSIQFSGLGFWRRLTTYQKNKRRSLR
jgi:hypothetical protein